MEKQTGETMLLEAETVPMTDEELEAFALQMAEELPEDVPPEVLEPKRPVRARPADSGPSPLENFEVWKKHPATKTRWRKNVMLALAVFGVLFVIHLRVPVQWLLPSAEDIARVELCPVTADGTTDVTDLRHPSVTHLCVTAHKNQIFLYIEATEPSVDPAAIVAGKFKAFPDGSNFFRMAEVFHYSKPFSEEHWKRKDLNKKPWVRINYLKPEMTSSYFFYHYLNTACSVNAS